ncbi:hypothetical protein V1514DRAFT_127854 [Lipomyces japonicus]|uniref:uncharacterized protein n=1 Tax=Lipomyces japonicus TaxID=56871 RepID=UPI0034CE6D9B
MSSMNINIPRLRITVYRQVLSPSLQICCRFSSTTTTATATTNTTTQPNIKILDKDYETDQWTNVGPAILSRVPRKLLLQPSHPLSIIKSIIESQFSHKEYTSYNNLSPIVSTYDNFDSLNFPQNHPGRSRTDTYYVNKNTVLRTHTSAHQATAFQNSPTPGYLIAADVYRRDEIDRSHYPAFHQMEGARTWDLNENTDPQELARQIDDLTAKIPRTDIRIVDEKPPFHEGNPKQAHHTDEVCIAVGNHMKRTLENVVTEIFNRASLAAGENASKERLQVRWIDAYFPFTSPSWEMEVFWNGDWLELFGSGVVQQEVFDSAKVKNKVGWAFGLGLERLAMVLFGIPDIRLFWSENPKFLRQFEPGVVSHFKPFSTFEGSTRDISFWLGDSQLHENDFMEIVRNKAGDLVESVELVDKFTNRKTGRTSLCFRINYNAMDRILKRDDVNVLNDQIRSELQARFGVDMR